MQSEVCYVQGQRRAPALPPGKRYAGHRLRPYQRLSRDGAYQLYYTSLTPEGAGDLSVAFEQLKEKLRKEGLFDETHKKPLPPYPRRIAIVTSPAGAAVTT